MDLVEPLHGHSLFLDDVQMADVAQLNEDTDDLRQRQAVVGARLAEEMVKAVEEQVLSRFDFRWISEITPIWI